MRAIKYDNNGFVDFKKKESQRANKYVISIVRSFVCLALVLRSQNIETTISDKAKIGESLPPQASTFLVPCIGVAGG